VCLKTQGKGSYLCGKLINITTLPLFCVHFSLLSLKYVADSSVLLMEKNIFTCNLFRVIFK
jgi:hypothetical protein